MKLDKRAYLLLFLGILGVVLSYFKFLEWFSFNGFDIIGGWKEGFSASLFATGFILDLVAITFMVFALTLLDSKKLGAPWVIAIFLCTLVFSVSIGLAIYLVKMQCIETNDKGEQAADI